MKKKSNTRRESSDDEEEVEVECNGVVNVQGSDIFYNGDVTDENVGFLIQSMGKTEKKLRKMAVDFDGFEPGIRLYINSEGGSVFAGLSAMNHIESCRVPVTTIADGLCASAATFMLLGGRTRLIRKNAFILIHQMTVGMWGDYKFTELNEEMYNNKKIMKMLRKLYTDKTEIPEKKLKALMTKDVLLSSRKCIKYGIVSAYL